MDESPAPARVTAKRDGTALQIAKRDSAAVALAGRIEADSQFDSAISVRDYLLRFPEFRRIMVATAVRCMGARKAVYDKDAQKWEFAEDGPTQMKAVAFLAAYSEGIPAQTNVNLNIGDRAGKKEDAMTLEQALRESPALRERLRATVEAAGQGSGKPMKRAEATSDASQ